VPGTQGCRFPKFQEFQGHRVPKLEGFSAPGIPEFKVPSIKVPDL